jgi:thioredoxin
MREVLWVAAIVIVALLLMKGLTQSRSYPEPPADKWFQAEVVQQQRPVLVKFGAKWCPPCRAMEPELDEVESKLGDKVHVVRIDTDERPEIASHYGVSGIPRTFVFDNGKAVDDRTGLLNAEEMTSWLDRWL